MAYPSSIDSFGSPAGTSLLTSPDHAADHQNLGKAIINIENATGTTSATAALKNITVGNFAVSNNSGTLNNGVLGTPSITGGTIGTATIQGGTLANAAIGTPTVIGGTIAVNGTTTALSIGAAFVPTAGSLTDTAGGTHTVNAQAAQVYQSVLGTAAGNRTVNTPANPTAWQTLNFAFKSSGSANGTLVWGTAFQISQDAGTPTIGTGTSWNWYAWRYNPIDTRWHFQGQSKNLI